MLRSRAASLQTWAENVVQLVRGRPKWSARDEFDYYGVTETRVREHRERQVHFARESWITGLRIVRALGLLDTRLTAGARVLDLGAGECLLSEALALCCGAAEVWATDAVPKQIWAAAERYQGHERLRFAIADACDLPFADGSFDIVTANLVLHHIEPLGPLLSEARRVLRPGGRFCAFEPSPLVGALVHEKNSANEAPVSPAKITSALREAGFEAVEQRYFWSRMETSLLGPLSPGYRVSGQRPGSTTGPNPSPLRRELVPMRLPGLLLDQSCSFASLIREQEQQILDLLT